MVKKTLKRTQKIILASVNSMLMLEDTFVWSIDAMLKTLIFVYISEVINDQGLDSWHSIIEV